MAYTVVGDDMRAKVVTDNHRVAIREANKLQKQDLLAFIAVYIYRDGVKVGDRCGAREGWCEAASENYPDASHKVKVTP